MAATSIALVFIVLSALGPLSTFASPSSIITSAIFDQLFPNRNPFYTYDDFILASQSYPAFGNTGNADVQARELAAFLGNVIQETGSLQAIREYNQSNNYCDSRYPCPDGKKYFGRGPLQLSWNYNYQAAGNALGLDLINDPDLLATNVQDSFRASLWYWMQASSPACHDVMTTWQPSSADVAANRLPGFGATIRLINGFLECGKGNETPQATNRITYFRRVCSMLGVDPGENLSCANMQAF